MNFVFCTCNNRQEKKGGVVFNITMFNQTCQQGKESKILSQMLRVSFFPPRAVKWLDMGQGRSNFYFTPVNFSEMPLKLHQAFFCEFSTTEGNIQQRKESPKMLCVTFFFPRAVNPVQLNRCSGSSTWGGGFFFPQIAKANLYPPGPRTGVTKPPLWEFTSTWRNVMTMGGEARRWARWHMWFGCESCPKLWRIAGHEPPGASRVERSSRCMRSAAKRGLGRIVITYWPKDSNWMIKARSIRQDKKRCAKKPWSNAKYVFPFWIFYFQSQPAPKLGEWCCEPLCVGADDVKHPHIFFILCWEGFFVAVLNLKSAR